MTIQIKPEQERVIGQAIKAGLIMTADQALEVGGGSGARTDRMKARS